MTNRVFESDAQDPCKGDKLPSCSENMEGNIVEMRTPVKKCFRNNNLLVARSLKLSIVIFLLTAILSAYGERIQSTGRIFTLIIRFLKQQII